MEIVRRVIVPGPADAVFALVDDLDNYPSWMELVHEVDEVGVDEDVESEDVQAGRGAAPANRAWDVELRARLGPIARSKRLRMERTAHDPYRRVVFERAEGDGRAHAPWVLEAAVVEVDGGAELTMALTYGGGLWTGAVMQRVLDEHVERGAAALRDLLARQS